MPEFELPEATYTPEDERRAALLRELIGRNPNDIADDEVSAFFSPNGKRNWVRTGVDIGSMFARGFLGGRYPGKDFGIETPSEVIRKRSAVETARKNKLFEGELDDLAKKELASGRIQQGYQKLLSQNNQFNERMEQEQDKLAQKAAADEARLAARVKETEGRQAAKEKELALKELGMKVGVFKSNPTLTAYMNSKGIDIGKVMSGEQKLTPEQFEEFEKKAIEIGVAPKAELEEIKAALKVVFSPQSSPVSVPVEKPGQSFIDPLTGATVRGAGVMGEKTVMQKFFPEETRSRANSSIQKYLGGAKLAPDFVPPARPEKPIVKPEVYKPTPVAPAASLSAPRSQIFDLKRGAGRYKPGQPLMQQIPKAAAISNNGTITPGVQNLYAGFVLDTEGDPKLAQLVQAEGEASRETTPVHLGGSQYMMRFRTPNQMTDYTKSVERMAEYADMTDIAINLYQKGQLTSGPLGSAVTKIAGYFGHDSPAKALLDKLVGLSGTPGQRADASFQNAFLAGQLDKAFMAAVYDASGKQINQNEMDLIRGIHAKYTEVPDRLLSRLIAFRLQNDSAIHRSKLAVMLGGRYNDSIRQLSVGKELMTRTIGILEKVKRGETVTAEDFDTRRLVKVSLAKLTSPRSREFRPLAEKILNY